jgi:predicted dehydrogenase
MQPLRGILVGAGGMGRTWAKNLAEYDQVNTVGWIDIRPGAASQAAQDLGLEIGHTGEDLEQALADLKPDFLVDVTIPEAHHDVTLMALARGIPVIGEKPMADTLARAQAMVAASERHNTLYMVSQSRRYDARIHAFRALIAAQVGQLGMLKSDFYIGAHFGGFRDEMAHVLLLDMAIHTLDAARYLSGSDPVAVYCEEYNPPWSWYAGAACATALFEMTNGLRYTYAGSWCAEGRHTSWEAEWRAVGAKGSATWDGRAPAIADTVMKPGGFHSEMATQHAEEAEGVAAGIAGSIRDFVHAVRTGSTPMGECHDNIKSLAMVFAAIESADTGKRVQVRW